MSTQPISVQADPRDEIISEIVRRAGIIASVLEREHSWLAPKVKFSRDMDDADIEYSLAHNHYGEEEATERRSEDNLVLKRNQVDTHLSNLKATADHVRDAAATLEAWFLPAPKPSSEVHVAIAAHIAAVEADEAQFDINGKPLEEAKAAETEAAEEAAFAVFVETPCPTSADVHAKIEYLVNGTIGERDSLITYLQIRDLVEPFLKSLAIATVEG